MSEEEGSSGEECSLRIDTGRKTNTTTTATSDRSKGRGGRGKGKGRGRGSGQHDPADAPKIGDVVWAKVMGFNFWPAKVTFSGMKRPLIWIIEIWPHVRPSIEATSNCNSPMRRGFL